MAKTKKEKLRENVLNKCEGRCGYCGILLNGIRWHIDHVEPVERISEYKKGKGYVQTGKMAYPENDIFENMMPSCPSCNIQKHSFGLEEFRKNIQNKLVQLEKQTQYRIAKRYGLLKETPIEIIFYFEKN